MKIFQVLSKWTDKSLEVPTEITLHKTFDNKEKAEEFSKELFQKLLKEFKSMFPTKFLLMGDYNQDFLYTEVKAQDLKKILPMCLDWKSSNKFSINLK